MTASASEKQDWKRIVNVLDVPCPACDAGFSVFCRRVGNKVRSHDERHRLARKTRVLVTAAYAEQPRDAVVLQFRPL